MNDTILAYLKSKNPTTELIKATALSGGASTDTILADVHWVMDRKEEDAGLVFKIHRDAGVLGEAADQIKEFKVLEALMDEACATPKVYWAEDDPKWFGAPFFVMEKASGTASTSSFLKKDCDEANRISVCKDLCLQMARLHKVDPKKGELTKYMKYPETDEDCALNEINLYEHLYRQKEIYPDPALEVVLDWLKTHAPKKVSRKSIVWGDPGPGNFMHKDGKVTALIDWEIAHIGDPMEDIALTMNKLMMSAQIMSTEELFQFYEEASGAPVDRAAVEYYRVLWHFKMTMISNTALYEFHTEATDNIFTGYTGTLFRPWEMIKAYDIIQELEGGKFYAANN